MLERDPLDWYIEVCAVCGGQLGPGVGSRTPTGRCVVEAHRSRGGRVIRVCARPSTEQAYEQTGDPGSARLVAEHPEWT